MATKRDLTGLSYGWLEVVRLARTGDDRKAYWDCKCRCGKEKEVRQDALLSGDVVSCGCRRKDTEVLSRERMRRPKAMRVKAAKAAANARWRKKEDTDGRVRAGGVLEGPESAVSSDREAPGRDRKAPGDRNGS